MLLKDYVLLDRDIIRTYLFNHLASGDVEAIFAWAVFICVEETLYYFDKNLNLFMAAPLTKNSTLITEKGYIKPKSLSRIIHFHEKIDIFGIGNYVKPGSDTQTICSGYICLYYPPENHIKITRENLVVVNPYKPGIEIEEKNDELIITNKKKVDATLGVKIGDVVYQFYELSGILDYKIIVTKGTCFRVKDYVTSSINNETKLKFRHPNEEIYLCY